MKLSIAKVVKRDGKWYVLSKKGKKLGGPYDTRKAALKRLREVEHFKRTKGDMNKLEYKLFSTAASIIEPDVDSDSQIREKLVKANKLEKTDEDLLHVRFILCHEGANNNKDGFMLSELQENYETAVYKDINVEHTDKIVGVITASRFIDKPEDASFASMAKAEDFKPHIECDAVIYKYKFPEVADEVVLRHSLGSLRFSMETWFNAAKCDKCDAEFVAAEDYCDHLANRFAEGSDETRWLVGITFGGAAVVENPADKDAKGLSVAQLSEFDLDWIIPNMDLDDLEKLTMGLVERLKMDDLVDENKLKERLTNILNNLSVLTMASESDADKNTNNTKGEYTMPFEFASEKEMLASDIVQDAIETALAERSAEQDTEDRISKAEEAVEQKEQELVAKEEELTAANERADNAEKELADYKEAQAKKELIADRYNELSEAGVKFPEDEEKLTSAKDRLGEMDETAYADYKEMLLANISEKAEASEQEEEAEEEEESLEIPQVQATFDMAVATDDEFEKLADEAFGDVSKAE
jgi:hypothetical protein